MSDQRRDVFFGWMDPVSWQWFCGAERSDLARSDGSSGFVSRVVKEPFLDRTMPADVYLEANVASQCQRAISCRGHLIAIVGAVSPRNHQTWLTCLPWLFTDFCTRYMSRGLKMGRWSPSQDMTVQFMCVACDIICYICDWVWLTQCESDFDFMHVRRMGANICLLSICFLCWYFLCT